MRLPAAPITPKHVTRPCGGCCWTGWAGSRTQSTPGPYSRACRPCSVSNRLLGWFQRRIGLRGRARCLFCAQDLAAQHLQCLAGDGGAGVRQLARCGAARALPQTEGWVDRSLPAPPRPPNDEAGPGDWPHGWQFHTSRTHKTYFGDRALLPALPASHCAAPIAGWTTRMRPPSLARLP